jgi:hypothetical protein
MSVFVFSIISDVLYFNIYVVEGFPGVAILWLFFGTAYCVIILFVSFLISIVLYFLFRKDLLVFVEE